MIISLLSKIKYTVSLFKHVLPLSFLIIFIAFYSSSYAQGQNEQITITYKNCNAQTLLKELDRQSAYSFFFDPTQMSSVQLQDISYNKLSLKAVLADLEKKTGLVFSTLNSNISVRYAAKAPVKKPDPGKLSGRILDEKGETFPGASIRVAELNMGMQSAVDGTYTLPLPPGTYTLEISYISYQIQEITGVKITAGGVTKLDISMKPADNSLKEVVVTSGYQKASTAGLYARQKTAAAVTDGISAEQIARTPDNNVGAVLKRVSGLNVVDNRYVVVRGLSDRYNQAQIDGVAQPSTRMNQRNFAFDAIPTEMVSSVVVTKTATPDISAEFAGGQVTVNTLDVPVQNFTQFQIGTGYNSNTIGKDFLQAGKRGAAEFLGIAAEGHKLAPNLRTWSYSSPIPDYAVEQSKTFDPEGWRLYRYPFQPIQNYRFTFGRVYPLKNNLKFGFVGGITLRNTLEINDYISTRAGFDFPNIDSAHIQQNGNIYKYNSTVSGLFNVGVQGRGFKLGFKNMYSHVYKNEYYVYESRSPNEQANASPNFRRKYNLQAPESTTVLQNRLEGEHNIGDSGVKLNWNGSYTEVGQQINDRRRFIALGSGAVNGIPYYQRYVVANASTNDGDPDYRLYMDTRQTDYNWGVNLSKSINLLHDKTSFKIGYSGFSKKRDLSNTTVRVYNSRPGILFVAPYEYSMRPENVGVGKGQAFYDVPTDAGGQFKGSAKLASAFLMADQSFFKKLRLVYGVRYENYKLANTQFKSLDADVNKDDGDKFLPSINLTYSPIESINVRASYANTLVRPDFRETSIFGIYDPELDALIQGANVKSTFIKNTDLRFEWFPSAGEIVSFSGFYKQFDKPIELIFLQDAAVDIYQFQNQKSATNYGLEMEIRKSLAFIADRNWLKNLSVFGNGTLIKSKVKGLVYSGPKRDVITEAKYDRPLFGQAPWIINFGLTYSLDQYGINAVYNRSGYRTYTINYDPNNVEYEQGRNMVDLQVFTRLFNKKAELKINIANLLNTKLYYYKNSSGYTQQGESYTPIDGKNDNYKKEDGDYKSYEVKTGVNYTLAFTYRF
jgi:outer membrane receptor protein involved in Fe transport